MLLALLLPLQFLDALEEEAVLALQRLRLSLVILPFLAETVHGDASEVAIGLFLRCYGGISDDPRWISGERVMLVPDVLGVRSELR